MDTIHYIDTAGRVYGYKPEDLQVREMSNEEFESFKAEQEEYSQKDQERQEIIVSLKNVRDEISTLKDIDNRSEAEEIRLQELKTLSTNLYRDLQEKESS